MQAQRSESKRKLPPGIDERHSRHCATTDGYRCNCQPSYRAWVYDKREQTKIRKTFSGRGALAAAKSWRASATTQLELGRNVAQTRKTLREAAELWLAGAKASPPTILNRSGRPYKPSVLRGYEADLNQYVLPELGAMRLGDVRRRDLQALIERLLGRALSASKVRNVLIAVRVVFRHALDHDEVGQNPTSGLRLPNGIGQRDRAASPQEAAELLAALPDELRPIYATAFYSGLRRGELRGLRWDDVDLAAGIIHVRRSWDEYEGEIDPKSVKGARRVPMIALLRDHLDAHKTAGGADRHAFVFPSQTGAPFTPSHVRRQAAKAWEAANKERAEHQRPPLVPIGLHECRHTFVTLMHEAGVSLEETGDLVGHSSTYMTDRYRHLREDRRQEAARRLDAYLALADTSARVEQLPDPER